MSDYGWVITRDLISEKDEKPSVGVKGPRGITAEIESRLDAGEGRAFRMLDDDGGVYYYGRLIDPEEMNDFAPLDDFGEPFAGCSTIQVPGPGGWATV